MSSKKIDWGIGKVEFTALWPEIKSGLDRGRKVVDVYDDLVGKNRLTMKIQTFYTHCRQARNRDDRSDATNVEIEAAAAGAGDTHRATKTDASPRVLKTKPTRDVSTLKAVSGNLLAPAAEAEEGHDDG